LLLRGCGILVSYAALSATERASRSDMPLLMTHDNALPDVVAGLVAAASIVLALCLQIQGRRDKPGDDAYM
jgi:hypothetical protein